MATTSQTPTDSMQPVQPGTFGAPGGSGGQGAPTMTPAAPTRQGRRRFAELGATALIAAVAAGGTTLAVTHTGPDSASAVTSAAASDGASATTVASTLPATGWAAVAAKVSPAVVAITVQGVDGSGGQGSGVVWDAKGDIVTNNHVVAGAGAGAQLQVRLGAQHTYAATIVGTDPTTDLAVIRLTDPPSNLTPIGRAGSDSVRVGDPVMALGNPLGLSGTVTTGIVSALGRPVTTSAVTDSPGQAAPAATSSAQVFTNAIQTSAAINPGNSGGALVDASGRLVGINSSIAQTSQNGGNIGIGFAIPVQEVNSIATQLIASGRAQHSSLGVQVRDAQVKQGSASVSGAGIGAVVPGSPAAAAGLAAGDVVTAVDSTPVDSADALVAQVRGLPVGQKITVTVLSAQGQSRQVAVTLAAQSAQQS